MTPHNSIQQLHSAVFSVSEGLKKGQTKYIQIQPQKIGVTANQKEKTAFEKVAHQVQSLQRDALKNEEDLKLYIEIVAELRKIAPSQQDWDFLSFIGLGENKSEKLLEQISIRKLEQSLHQMEMEHPSFDDKELLHIMQHTKLRSHYIPYMLKPVKEKMELAKKYGVSEPAAWALVLYSLNAYKMINAHLRGQKDVMLKEIEETQKVLRSVSLPEFYQGMRDLRVIGNQEQIFKYFSAECEVVAKTIDEGLSKIPKYVGTIYRGDLLTDEEFQRLESGEYYDLAYMSFSTDEEVSKDFATRKPTNGFEKHPVVFVVQSKTGSETSLISSHPEEKEVTYGRGQKLKVISKEIVEVPQKNGPPKKILYVKLEEK